MDKNTLATRVVFSALGGYASSDHSPKIQITEYNITIPQGLYQTANGEIRVAKDQTFRVPKVPPVQVKGEGMILPKSPLNPGTWNGNGSFQNCGSPALSMVSFLNKPAPSTLFRTEWFHEHLYDAEDAIQPTEAVIGSGWKYIKYLKHDDAQSEELYALSNDPYEMANPRGNPEYQGILTQLRNKTREFEDQLKEHHTNH